jgi:DNA-binding CsgD family transcriptional regulator
MSQSAKNSDLILIAIPRNNRIKNKNFMLVMNLQITEMNQYGFSDIKIDGPQFINLLRSISENSEFLKRNVEDSENKSIYYRKKKVRALHIVKRKDLSEREIELMERIVSGLSNQEIADDLGLRLNTVKSHLQRIYIIFDVTNRHAAKVEFLKRLGKSEILPFDE